MQTTQVGRWALERDGWRMAAWGVGANIQTHRTLGRWAMHAHLWVGPWYLWLRLLPRL
jgi:hypothetical protein